MGGGLSRFPRRLIPGGGAEPEGGDVGEITTWERERPFGLPPGAARARGLAARAQPANPQCAACASRVRVSGSPSQGSQEAYHRGGGNPPREEGQGSAQVWQGAQEQGEGTTPLGHSQCPPGVGPKEGHQELFGGKSYWESEQV